jgi:hypothetical protein
MSEGLFFNNMSNINFNISDLLKVAFNVSGYFPFSGQQYAGALRNLVNPYQVNGDNESKDIVYPKQDIKKQAIVEQSVLGTPIIMPFAFDLSETVWYDKGTNKKIKWKDIHSETKVKLPPAIMVDFNQSKIIEKTRIAGRDGTVKENIGLDDWSIRIRGIAVNENADEPPHDFIQLLNEVKKVPVEIAVNNEMCNWLGIKMVTIEDIEYTSLEGVPAAQPFIITMSSDTVFELKYKEGL